MTHDYASILFESTGRVAKITFNRPEKRNAIDARMVEELHDAIGRLERDREMGACIFTGAGEKAFVGGADIAQLRDRTAADAFLRVNTGLFSRIEALPIPTIAAIRGYCLGGGCELAMSCDLRVAGKGARFGQPEVALGIIPGAGGTQRLPRLVGLGRAKELIYTGRIIEALEAERIGLVNRVVPDVQVVSAAEDLALEILKNGALALRLAKTCLNESSRTGLETGLLLEQISQAVLFDSEEKRARMTAFLKRRKKKP